MRVLSVPGRLRAAILVLGFSIPMAALQTAVIAQAPWWNLPWRSIQLWSITVTLIIVPLAAAIAAGRAWAWNAMSLFAGLWCLLSAWVALRMSSTSQGFFTILLLAYWGGVLSWLRFEQSRSYFDPRLKWYQGLPRPIPGLTCILEGQNVRVGRFDAEGAFVFVEHGKIPGLRASQPVSLTFRFKELEIRCNGLPVRTLSPPWSGETGWAGAGLQFLGLNRDSGKRLGDFVELLRGEGHA